MQGNENYSGKAELITIKYYKFSSLNQNIHNINETEEHTFIEKGDVLTPLMPVIIQSNGEVWSIGSIFFTKYLKVNSANDYKTLICIANDLFDYYKFIECCEFEDKSLNWLYLPLEEEERVINRYVKHLDDLTTQHVLRESTRSRRINHVIYFYKFCFEHNLFDKNTISNGLPFKIIVTIIKRMDSLGFSYKRKIETTNLSRAVAKKKPTIDSIADGRTLHPIKTNDLNIAKEYLNNHPSRAFQLFFEFALETGARSQTISTIRIHHIKEIIDSQTIFNDRVQLLIGGRTTIDSKFSHERSIYIPKSLCHKLLKYTLSETWRKNAETSYYGVSDKNYIFLTNRGTPYYTSKSDLTDSDYNNADLGIAVGGTLRSQLNTLLEPIIENYPNFPKFSIHDLRATFAMDIFADCVLKNFNTTQATLLVSTLLGHKSTTVTERYLDSFRDLDLFNSAQQNLEQKLLSPLKGNSN